jgi:hypothetical protein
MIAPIGPSVNLLGSKVIHLRADVSPDEAPTRPDDMRLHRT